jgi:Holliday junction resolvase-like predicted endonuclease
LKVSSFHIGIAAEALAAGLFARHGYNVSVQYGANQPEYDLLVERADELMKVSVKGSQDGSWGLTQSFKKDKSYHEAAEIWQQRHGKRTVICLVQFKGINVTEMPRVYLALPNEIAEFMKKSRNGHGETILHENHTYKSGIGAGTTDKLPLEWRFSAVKIETILLALSKL